MKLCSKCLSIPFENPPPLPKNYSDSLPGLPENDDLYYVEHRDTHSRPPHTFEHPHYQSEPELKTSAQNCQLCRLILREFHRIIASVQHPMPTYRFLITRREGKQDGFVVWTSGHDGSIWRVGAYGYCVKDATDPLSSVFKGREIEKDPSATNPGPFKVAEEWIHDCVKHHRLCGPRSPNPLLPTRVIDVGTSSSSVIKLLDTKGKFRGPYTLLSYSWGPPPHDYQTTLSNHSSYQTAIIFPKGKVPKTIVDAIELTRMLGIQYLWVDALCIIQDDAADWATESARMADYYGNGYLTITAAASKDAYMGCFLPRAPQSSARFHYTTNNGIGGELTVFALPPEKENIQANYVVFEAEPITGRGWTLQERVLTTRNLIYATDQMYWECNEHFFSEDGLHVEGRQSGIDPNTRELSLFGRKKQDLRDMWDVLVQGYGNRELTHPDKNKLVAISGLAQKFAKLLGGDEYIVGLWKKRLVESLFWSLPAGLEAHILPPWQSTWPPARYRAPSWSWACLDAPIYNPDERIYAAEKYATVVKYAAPPKDKAHPYGQITPGAYLVLNAPPLMHLRLEHYTKDKVRTYTFSRLHDSHAKTVSVGGSTTLDYNLPPRVLQKLAVYALVLARDTFGSNDDTANVNYLCLLVTPVGNSYHYRRLGILWLDEESLGQHASPRYADQEQWPDIRLI